jgi:hypothetical protein
MPDPSSALATVSLDTNAEHRRRFSEILSDLASRPVAAISLGDVLDAFGDRAFGALMLLFVTAQLMVCRPTLWMPRFIRRQSIRRDFFALLTIKLSPVLQRSERILRPRLSLLLHPVKERLVGAACLLLAIILLLPIPFGNIPPAWAIAAFALGILERDGLATLVGWFGTIGSLLILAAVSSAIVVGIDAFLTHPWVLS